MLGGDKFDDFRSFCYVLVKFNRFVKLISFFDDINAVYLVGLNL